MKILALLPGAAALDVVHAHGDGVVGGVHHGAVAGMREAAVRLPPSAVPPLELPAHLWSRGRTRAISRPVERLDTRLQHVNNTLITW